MTTYSFKTAELDDVDALVSLDAELFSENCFNEKTISTQLVNGTAYIVEADSKPVGYVIVADTKSDLIDIIRLGVLKEFRHQNLGTSLMSMVLDLQKDTMLTVRKDNTPALNLYLRHGFEIVGVLPQHESWVMRRSTTTSS